MRLLLRSDARTMPLAACSVSAIVTDPPYGLKFMGVGWDTFAGRKGDRGHDRSVGFDRTGGNHNPTCAPDAARTRRVESQKTQAWHEGWASEALRVLKPGGHILAFGGTRTYHRLVCALEDAGFEIRDCLCWPYGSGFPKSLDVSKALDKAAGAEREVVGQKHVTCGTGEDFGKAIGTRHKGTTVDITAPATDLARKWSGWGTALKPAHEPIVLARKPLSERNVAANVARWGTGALNIGASRIPCDGVNPAATRRSGSTAHCQPGVYRDDEGKMQSRSRPETYSAPRPGEPEGRWPANVLLDEEAARMLDEQSGESTSPEFVSSGESGRHGIYNGAKAAFPRRPCHGDSGGASRFFYVAKASRSERERGLDGHEIVTVEWEGWDGEALKARLRVATAASRPRVIAASGVPNSDATEWSTFLFGRPTTGRSLLGIRSITATANGWTTESRTLRFLARSLTSAGTPVASSRTASGGSPAESAERGTPLLTITVAKTGSPLGVGPAASATRLRISGNVGSPADHPTVKPVALMEHLVRLVTPPGGVVLDPFLGSGTTGIAARALGFPFVGLDLSADYLAVAAGRTTRVQRSFA